MAAAEDRFRNNLIMWGLVLLFVFLIAGFSYYMGVTSDEAYEVAYSDGAKCATAYIYAKGQEDVNYFIKRFPVSDSCKYVMEEKIHYVGLI